MIFSYLIYRNLFFFNKLKFDGEVVIKDSTIDSFKFFDSFDYEFTFLQLATCPDTSC